jgi:hypothetical protein
MELEEEKQTRQQPPPQQQQPPNPATFKLDLVWSRTSREPLPAGLRVRPAVDEDWGGRSTKRPMLNPKIKMDKVDEHGQPVNMVPFLRLLAWLYQEKHINHRFNADTYYKVSEDPAMCVKFADYPRLADYPQPGAKKHAGESAWGGVPTGLHAKHRFRADEFQEPHFKRFIEQLKLKSQPEVKIVEKDWFDGGEQTGNISLNTTRRAPPNAWVNRITQQTTLCNIDPRTTTRRSLTAGRRTQRSPRRTVLDVCSDVPTPVSSPPSHILRSHATVDQPMSLAARTQTFRRSVPRRSSGSAS